MHFTLLGSAGVDPLPPELEGQVETELLAVPFFIEMAVVLPQYRALLLADTGGLVACWPALLGVTWQPACVMQLLCVCTWYLMCRTPGGLCVLACLQPPSAKFPLLLLLSLRLLHVCRGLCGCQQGKRGRSQQDGRLGQAGTRHSQCF